MWSLRTILELFFGRFVTFPPIPECRSEKRVEMGPERCPGLALAQPPFSGLPFPPPTMCQVLGCLVNAALPLLSWVNALALGLSGRISRARLLRQSPQWGPALGTCYKDRPGTLLPRMHPPVQECFHARSLERPHQASSPNAPASPG